MPGESDNLTAIPFFYTDQPLRAPSINPIANKDDLGVIKPENIQIYDIYGVLVNKSTVTSKAEQNAILNTLPQGLSLIHI